MCLCGIQIYTAYVYSAYLHTPKSKTACRVHICSRLETVKLGIFQDPKLKIVMDLFQNCSIQSPGLKIEVWRYLKISGQNSNVQCSIPCGLAFRIKPSKSIRSGNFKSETCPSMSMPLPMDQHYMSQLPKAYTFLLNLIETQPSVHAPQRDQGIFWCVAHK